MVERPRRDRLAPGDVVPARTLTTITGERRPVPDPDAVIHLQFRRFAACPICNIHLQSYRRRHEEILAAGVVEVAVFYSEVALMLPHQGELPFAVVSDPERTLYQEFGVDLSPRAVLNPAAWTSFAKPEAWRVGFHELRQPGARPFRIRGGPMTGLPADFLIDSDGAIRAVHYGKHADDQWTVDAMLELRRATAVVS